jgi:hypothetical protein
MSSRWQCFDATHKRHPSPTVRSIHRACSLPRRLKIGNREQRSQSAMGSNSGAKFGSLSASGNVFRAVQSEWKAGVEEFGNDRIFGRQAAATRNDARTSRETRIGHGGCDRQDDCGRCSARVPREGARRCFTEAKIKRLSRRVDRFYQSLVAGSVRNSSRTPNSKKLIANWSRTCPLSNKSEQ